MQYARHSLTDISSHEQTMLEIINEERTHNNKPTHKSVHLRYLVGELLEQLGEREGAVQYYQYVVKKCDKLLVNGIIFMCV